MIGELAALGAAISWTVSAVLYRKALQHIKPASANILRLSCTSGILLTFLIFVGKFGVLITTTSEIVSLAILSGVIGLGLGDTLYLVSLKMIGVARAVPATCTYPLFNLLWAIFLMNELVTLSAFLGAIIIVIGIWLLSYEKENDAVDFQKGFLVKGLLLALATALLWSISIATMDLAVTKAPDLDHALVVNTVRTVGIAGFLLAFSPIIDRKRGFLKVDRKTVATLIVGGVVALGLGWFFLAYSLAATSESLAVPISSTTPLFSTLVGVVWLKEKITARNALGSIAIVAGIFLLFLV